VNIGELKIVRTFLTVNTPTPMSITFQISTVEQLRGAFDCMKSLHNNLNLLFCFENNEVCSEKLVSLDDISFKPIALIKPRFLYNDNCASYGLVFYARVKHPLQSVVHRQMIAENPLIHQLHLKFTSNSQQYWSLLQRPDVCTRLTTNVDLAFLSASIVMDTNISSNMNNASNWAFCPSVVYNVDTVCATSGCSAKAYFGSKCCCCCFALSMDPMSRFMVLAV
jgi:hypothetical protein